MGALKVRVGSPETLPGEGWCCFKQDNILQEIDSKTPDDVWMHRRQASPLIMSSSCNLQVNMLGDASRWSKMIPTGEFS